MKARILLSLFLCLFLDCVFGQTIESTHPEDTTRSKARALYTDGIFRFAFEANVGQTEDSVKFLSRSPGAALFLTSDAAVLVMSKITPRYRVQNTTLLPRRKSKASVLRMRLQGADPHVEITGQHQLPGKVNYFLGSDPKNWHSSVPQYTEVHYKDLYPGVDLIYYGNQGELEYDFVVRPNTNPAMILFSIESSSKADGSTRVRIAQGGDLLVDASGTIRLKCPVAYQLKNGKQDFIPVRYRKRGRSRIGFELGAYDKSKDLIIDPVLSYSSFLGGSADDFGFGMAVDADGNLYVTGGTTSADFPVTSGVVQSSYGGADSNVHNEFGDIFVAKLDPSGKTIIYSTYLGGSGDENAHGIAVDAAGNAYITGETNSADYPVTAGAFQTIYAGGGDDALVTKLNSTGSALLYSTYLGSSEGEGGFGIAIDKAGNAYVTGAAGPNFPTTVAAYHGGISDVFVVEMNASGTALVFSTLVGGSMVENGTGIALDSSGNIAITGYTQSPDLQVTPNAAQTHLAGGYDAFVALLDTTGKVLYCTYLGGTGEDNSGRFAAIAVDGSNKVYVTGETESADFPTTAGAFQSIFGGGSSDAFVAKLDPAATSSLVYSTFLGGSGNEATEQFGFGIAVDTAGNAVVTGSTSSPDFPIFRPAQTAFGGGEDVFVTKLNASGSGLVFSTYLGSTQNDYGGGVVIDKAGNTYVTGQTGSGNFTTISPVQPTLNGPTDAFIAKFTADFDLNSSPATVSITAGQSATYSITVTPSDGLYGIPVSLACSGVPALSTCSISPQQVTPGSSPVSATLTIATTAPQSSRLIVLSKLALYALFLPLLWSSAERAKRGGSARVRSMWCVIAVLLLVLTASLLGCGGSSSPQTQPKQGTPTGTSTITITASSASMSHKTTVTLNVM